MKTAIKFLLQGLLKVAVEHPDLLAAAAQAVMEAASKGK
jgi:hypothetical protein